MKKNKKYLLYFLLLVPTVTELMEAGHFPTTAHDILTDITMTILVLVFLIASNTKNKKIERLEEEIKQKNNYDPLTNLPMRDIFKEELKQAIEHARLNKEELRIACIDIDHFKTVNEFYGTAMGDEIIKNLALRIKSIVTHDKGRVYRLGGDVFAVLFTKDGTQDTEKMITDIVTLKANGNKLMEQYKSSIAVGTARLSTNDNALSLWKRAIQSANKKNKESI